MIPYSQYSLLYHEIFYDFNFFNCTRVQFPALEFGCWSQPLIKGLTLLEEDVLWCLQVPASSRSCPPRHGFLQLFWQTLSRSCKEQVQLLEVINLSAPIAPLLKSRQWSQILGCDWQRLGVHGNSHWADASFSCCNSLFPFCLCQSGEGRFSPLLSFAFHSCKLLQQGWVASCSRTRGRSRLSLIITAVQIPLLWLDSVQQCDIFIIKENACG